MVEYEPICNFKKPISNDKCLLSERWKVKVLYPTEDEVYSLSLRCFTVRPLRRLIQELLGKRGFEEYRHIIPEIIEILYHMGTSSRERK